MNETLQGDSLEVLRGLADESVDCVITSPPYYGLRDYGVVGQIGLEEAPEMYVQKLVEVFREVKRVLKKKGTLWLNLGDSYCGGGRGSGYNEKQDSNRGTVGMPKSVVPNGLKSKDLIGIPWRVAFALQADGWYLRQDIIWHKPNPMPESVTDRCTKSHEYVFLLTKSPQYFFDSNAILEPSISVAYDLRPPAVVRDREYGYDSKRAVLEGRGRGGGHKIAGAGHTNMAKNAKNPYLQRNKRSVWSIATHPYSGAHFATFPEALVEPMILAGCPKDGIVLDCFFGAGTTGVVAKKLGRNYIGIELNPEYIKIAQKRIDGVTAPLL